MRNMKTTTFGIRILEEKKELLQNEADARGLYLNDVIKEMIDEGLTKKVDASSGKNLIPENKNPENKNPENENPEKENPGNENPENENPGNENPENKEEKELDDLLRDAILYREKEEKIEEEKEKKKEKETEEEKEKKKEKGKVYGNLFADVITYDNEEESEKD